MTLFDFQICNLFFSFLGALEILRKLIRASTTSMTSVPKPLKFMIPHYETMVNYFVFLLNNIFLRERGMASNPKMEYRVFLFIFQKNSAMATLGLKEMGKFLLEGREKGLLNWDSQLGKLFSLPSQRNVPISFKPKVAIAKFVWKMQKQFWYYEKWVGRHASFPPRRYVNSLISLSAVKPMPQANFWETL